MIRDHLGQVVGCLSSSTTLNPHPLVAEYHTLWRALSFGAKLGLSDCNIKMEGDAQVLINAINDSKECNA